MPRTGSPLPHFVSLDETLDAFLRLAAARPTTDATGLSVELTAFTVRVTPGLSSDGASNRRRRESSAIDRSLDALDRSFQNARWQSWPLY